MNRQRCDRCPHKAYLHDDRRDPVGACMVDGCCCRVFVPEQGAQTALWDRAEVGRLRRSLLGGWEGPC